MRFWAVWESDYDSAWILAAYTTRELAAAHLAALQAKRSSRNRHLYIEEQQVFDTLQAPE